MLLLWQERMCVIKMQSTTQDSRSEWAINKGMQLSQEQADEKSEKHAAKTEVAEAQEVKVGDDSSGNECKSRQK